MALRTAQPPVDPARRVAGAAREVERLAQLERVVGELAARADADDRPDVVQSILSAAEAAQLVGRVAELERTVQGRLVDAPDASLDARHVAGGDPAAGAQPFDPAARTGGAQGAGSGSASKGANQPPDPRTKGALPHGQAAALLGKDNMIISSISLDRGEKRQNAYTDVRDRQNVYTDYWAVGEWGADRVVLRGLGVALTLLRGCSIFPLRTWSLRLIFRFLFLSPNYGGVGGSSINPIRLLGLYPLANVIDRFPHGKASFS